MHIPSPALQPPPLWPPSHCPNKRSLSHPLRASRRPGPPLHRGARRRPSSHYPPPARNPRSHQHPNLQHRKIPSRRDPQARRHNNKHPPRSRHPRKPRQQLRPNPSLGGGYERACRGSPHAIGAPRAKPKLPRWDPGNDPANARH